MKNPDYDGAIAYAIGRLRTELSSQFTYHNLWHTEQEVMPVAMQLARMRNLDEADIKLLEIATAFHDIGFTLVKKNHELTGARIVAQVLPDFGFDSTQIELIIGMIMATRLPQSPRTPLEECIADADLDVLGRDDFLDRNQCLRQELSYLGSQVTDQQWFEGQLKFVTSHSYFSAEAHQLRNRKKQENIEMLQERVSQLTNSHK
ncbi:MAG: HD domain-containing protein [Ardenticatenaceae bacterium]|nr:HD domain-containing protein [Ardenticatenaceae bacterium]